MSRISHGTAPVEERELPAGTLNIGQVKTDDVGGKSMNDMGGSSPYRASGLVLRLIAEATSASKGTDN